MKCNAFLSNDACRLRGCVAGLFLLILAVMSSVVLAQDLPLGTPSNAVLEAEIERVKVSVELSDIQKAQMLEQLSLGLARSDSAAVRIQRAQQYAESLTKAPREQAEFGAQLAKLGDAELPSELSNSPPDELEVTLVRENAKLAALRTRSANIDADIKKEKAFDIQTALLEAQRDTQERGVGAIDSPEHPSTERLLAEVTRYWQDSRVRMLEQALLSRGVRLSRWAAEQVLVLKQIAIAESRIAQLSTLISGHRFSDARRILAEAKSRLATLDEEPHTIRELGLEQVRYAEQLVELVTQHERSDRDKENISRKARELRQKFGSLTEDLQIERLYSSPEFGAGLRKQRDRLTRVSTTRRALGAYEAALTTSRLAQFQVDALREEEARSTYASITAQLKTDLPAELTPEREGTIRNLLAQREELLATLADAYPSYVESLTRVDAQSRALVSESNQYAVLLDQYLLWMPSASAIGLGTLSALGTSLIWLINPDSWAGLLENLLQRIARFAGLTFVVVILLFFLLTRRVRLLETLTSMKHKVGSVQRDRMTLTLLALLITLLLALPGPLLMRTMGGLLAQPASFSGALANALTYGALVYLILEFILQCVRKDGLAKLHFKWNIATISALKNNLPWFMAIFIPTIVINLFVELQGSAGVRDSLGRVAFVTATLVLATFTRRVLDPDRGILQAGQQGASASRPWQIRYIVFPILVLLPLLIAGLSIYGYHYTAVQIYAYMFETALAVLLGTLLFSLARRAFAIRERQLALKRIRAKRAAALAHSESPEATGEGLPTALDLKEIDLQTISLHTTALLKMLTTLAIGFALWHVWSGFLPAFEPLAGVHLWGSLELVNGVPISSAVTLWDLLLAIVLGVVTFAAAKNIPGLLEVALLSRMSLETGTSYAVTTIVRYGIVITGTIIVLQILGAQWSKLQWLIAALSVGLGFGLQEIVANFVSGVVLLFERPIRIGDMVTVGDRMGTVSRIRIRATTLVDWDRREIVIPNKTFITEQLVNWTLTDPITRTTVSVGVAYGSDVALTEKLLLDIAAANKKILDDPAPAAWFVRFGDNTLDFELRVFVSGVGELIIVTHEINVAIERSFREHGIEIAFPQRDIHFDPKPFQVQIVGPDANN
ncbi:MAG: small-conductance mechanosensitive channel [Gammaproteobacteria bacterium]|jgi:small-conductance mechanosensitive channel